jgi:DNA-binding beta-propeller fold protein YncE
MIRTRRQSNKILLFLCATVPALTLPIAAQTGVTAVLPNGRQIHPAGNWIPVAPYPFALSVRPDGAQIAVPSIGFPFALNVIDQPAGSNPTVHRWPAARDNDPSVEVHAGLAYSPDGSLLYVATGDSGKIRAYRTSDWKPVGEVSLDGPVAYPSPDAKENNFQHSFSATLIVSADGETLYALDQGGWRVVILDAAKMQLLASIPTGNYPYGLALSPDGQGSM